MRKTATAAIADTGSLVRGIERLLRPAGRSLVPFEPPELGPIAVTGPTGTFGFGLIPLLQADDRIERIIGIARRPFDPAEHGWTKMEYRQGDVRDPEGGDDLDRDRA